MSHNTFNILPATGPSSPPRGRGYIPASITLFLGRDSEVEELVLLLTQVASDGKRARICILGPGGMGKTELAMKVVNHPEIQRCYHLKNLLFVACIQAPSAALLLDTLYMSLNIKRDTHHTLNDILDELRSSGPLILVLDNLETALYANDATAEVEQILRDIEQIPHVALFVTMRGSSAPCEDLPWIEKKISPLDSEASHQLFTQICPKATEESKLTELLEVLGYMPLAVILMAKLGKATGWKAQELLDSFQMGGLTILGPSDGTDSRHSISVSIRLSVESPLIRRTQDATTLLAIISMLPSGTTSSNLRKYWALSLSNLPAALQALLDTSLLECRSEAYFVLPVIRSYILEPSHIPKDVAMLMVQGACKFLEEHNSSIKEASFQEHMLARSAIEVNLQTILLSTTESEPGIIQALLTLAWHQYRTRPRLEVIQHAVSLAEKIVDHRLQGQVLSCYATILHTLGNSDALKQLRLSRKSFIQASDTNNAAYILLRIARISTRIDAHFNELPLIKQAQLELTYIDKPLILKLIRQCQFLHPLFPANKSVVNRDIARCLMDLGNAYSHQRKYSKAIKPLIQAGNMCPEESFEGAYWAQTLAQTYQHLGNYERAEKLGLVAIKRWRQLGGYTDFPLLVLGKTYISMLNYDQAIQTLIEGLEVAKDRHVVHSIAGILLELGRAYMKKGEVQAAQSVLVETLSYYQALKGKDNEIVCARFFVEKIVNPSRLPNFTEKKALHATWHNEDIVG
ncbi:hypothetical protein C8J56DRAFT_1043089 [Mycena floridula]|nr:hypothetical protein C8J56DRAFT_1043089 [Mycena floridula]